ncbi:hypothetical protein JCM14036_17160 [Desulfotomaculum defluvii]
MIGGVFIPSPNKKIAIKKNTNAGEKINILIILYLKILLSVIKSTSNSESALKLHHPIADILFQKENICLSIDTYAKV